MKQPIWYKESEKFILNKGKGTILILLVVVILISLFFIVEIKNKRMALPAATWLVYLFMP